MLCTQKWCERELKQKGYLGSVGVLFVSNRERDERTRNVLKELFTSGQSRWTCNCILILWCRVFADIMYAVRVRWDNVAPVVSRRVRGMAPVARVKPGAASRPALGGSYTMIIFF